MSNKPSPTRESDGSAACAAAEATAPPWASYLAIIACVGVFLGLAWRNDYQSWDTLSRFGYQPAASVWNGAYWVLVTSAFVHFALWHVAFNVYWLWVLGNRMERAIRSVPFLAFVLASAFVSSSFQLAVSDDIGIGASGVVYAIFGFMWLTRDRYPQFRDVLDARTIQIFIIWLFGCMVATYLKVWIVGNAAHVAGLLFGGAVAGSFVPRHRRGLASAGLAALVVLAIVPLFWCPWSVTWLGVKAYNAHVAKRYDVAIERYGQVIRMNPANAWAYLNRSYAYQALGESPKAQADFEKARAINPSIEKAE